MQTGGKICSKNNAIVEGSIAGLGYITTGSRLSTATVSVQFPQAVDQKASESTSKKKWQRFIVTSER